MPTDVASVVERRIETAVVKTVSGSVSMRTTIPQPVAALLGLEPGDHMVWVVNPQAGTVGITLIHKRDLEPLPNAHAGAVEGASRTVRPKHSSA